jgi:FAD/FMN-containing dehydrogenase
MALINPVRISYSQSSLQTLRSQAKGAVIIPGDADYDQARMAWNLAVDQHPAVIVAAENSADVAAAVNFARHNGLGVTAQATGHGIARKPDGGVLILTAGMQGVEIDPEAQTAWVAAGVKWGAVLEKAQEHGLAPLLGSSPGVGAVGYTLGGGMGWLARKYGLSTDSVVYFEVVTADGRIQRVGPEENSDLFWGLRGSAGSLAVITGMRIQLYPVTTVYAGNLIYPAENAKEVYQRYREWIKNAPEELTSAISLMNMPPIPEVPEFLRGKSVVFVRGAYTGSMEAGQALIQSWLDWKAPIANMWGPLPWSQSALISNDPVDPMPGYATSTWLSDLSDEVIDVIVNRGLAANGSLMTFMEIRHAGGAIARGGHYPNAFGNRSAELILEMVGVAPTPEVHQMIKSYGQQVKQELQGHLAAGAYLNFLEGEEKWTSAKYAFSAETLRRLTTLKAKYDPENVFRYSLNLPVVFEN